MTPAPVPTITRVIKRQRVRAHGPGAAAHADASGATVRVVRSGDTVRAIVVTCPCGRTIELDCTTAEPPTPSRGEPS